jgi:CheY-like chemotaxis protein
MARVLVVDDQAFARASAAVVLRTNGFEVVGMEDGASAVKAFERSTFDVVIVDVYMPGMDGVQVIKALRQLAPHMPIVAVSGTMLRKSTRTALDYFPEMPALANVVRLQKPYRPPELLAAVGAAMGTSTGQAGEQRHDQHPDH